jgi:FkbM family methyltransferase
MKIDQYLKPKNIPGWLEKVLVSYQRKEYNKIPTYPEVETISEFYTNHGCNTFVDLGCWLGVLSAQVKKAVNPNKHIMIDAVPTYLYLAKSLLTTEQLDANIELIEMSIIDREEFPSHLTVNLDDTLNTSSIRTTTKADITVNLPIANPKTCNDAAIEIFNLAPNSTYLKMDLDGVDYSFLKSLISLNYLPSVIHFEAWLMTPIEFKECISILAQFEELGYKVPNPLELLGADIRVIVISRQQFKNIKVR